MLIFDIQTELNHSPLIRDITPYSDSSEASVSYCNIKKENSRPISRVLFLKRLSPMFRRLSFIQTLCRHKVQAFYPPAWAGSPHSAGIRELAAPKMHSRYVTIPLVGSYPTFSPLPLRAVIFFCITQPSRTPSILGSGMPYAARTFLSHLLPATGRPTVFVVQSYYFYSKNIK